MVTVSIHKLDLVGCTKLTSGVEDCFSTARVMGDLLWGALKPGLVLRVLY